MQDVHFKNCLAYATPDEDEYDVNIMDPEVENDNSSEDEEDEEDEDEEVQEMPLGEKAKATTMTCGPRRHSSVQKSLYRTRYLRYYCHTIS